MNVDQVVRKGPDTGALSDSRAAGLPVTPSVVLKELFELLEDYAPMWYTEEQHDRAVAALLQDVQQGVA